MAFSPALLICGGNGEGQDARTFYSTTTLIVASIFSIIALLNIFLYYRPGAGKYALLFALPGILAILMSVTAGGGIFLYYLGAILILTGLLRNSGLLNSFSARHLV